MPTYREEAAKKQLDAWQHTCPVCGKEFYRTHDWVYKVTLDSHIIFYCSYSCHQRGKQEKAAKHEARREARRRRQSTRIK